MIAYEVVGDIAVIRVENPPLNVTSQAVRAGLRDAFLRFADAPERAAVLCGAGKTFIAGADITEFGKPPREPRLPDIIALIEGQAKPVICVLHGVVLGGGLEVALGCHWRLGIAGVRLGLPEVSLGLIPGAGGTQRLPRLTGLEPAVEIITSARHVPGEEAVELGILDRLVAGSPQEGGIAFAREVLDADQPVRRVRDMAPPAQADLTALRARISTRHPGEPARMAAIDAALAGLDRDFDAGLAFERAEFMAMLDTPQRAALIHVFQAERRAARVPDGPAPRPLDHIGIVGGGTMGAGIAVSCLLADLPVTLAERDESAASRACATVTDMLAGSVKRGKITAARRDALLDMFTATAEIKALANADLVIEAVFESMEVKAEVFATLDRVCKPGAILATNTSYLDVNAIAATTARPGDVLGLHFFSPAHVMRLLEIVVADATAPDAVATGFELARRLRKVAVRAGVCDGFIGNRILSRTRAAVDHMVLDGASPFQVDRALVAFGLAMGPFAVADLAGLDIGYMTRQRKAATRDPRERVPAWGDRLHDMGRLGRKTGRGHYIYDAGSPKGRPDPEVEALIKAERSARGITPRDFSDTEIVDRYMAAMVDEAARILDEGIATHPRDIDLVLIHGYGFPRWRGGPMHYADQTGLDRIMATITSAAAGDAFFWRAAPLLARLAEGGRTFDTLNQKEAR